MLRAIFIVIVCICLLVPFLRAEQESEANTPKPITDEADASRSETRENAKTPAADEPPELKAQREAEFEYLMLRSKQNLSVGHMQVNANVPGSSVFIDGDYKGLSGPLFPLEIRNIPNGQVSVRISAQGYESQEHTLKVGNGRLLRYTFTLKPLSNLKESAKALTGGLEERKKAVLPDCPFDKQLLVQMNHLEKNNLGLWQAEFVNKTVMVYIPPVSYAMGNRKGAEDEKPEHTVQLSGYWLSQYEVTMAQYYHFIKTTGHRPLPDWVVKSSPTPNHPVTGVTWEDACAYCEWMQRRTGLPFRLPTEAEWEHAARGKERLRYPWGKHKPYYNKQYFANYEPHSFSDDGFMVSSPVGSFPHGTSPYGLYDMAGNVWEWCLDWYDSRFYASAGAKGANPVNLTPGQYRVVRGGSWYFDAEPLQSSYRDRFEPNYRYYDIGFRICLSEDKH